MEIVARSLIDLAKGGERDSMKLCDEVLQHYQEQARKSASSATNRSQA